MIKIQMPSDTLDKHHQYCKKLILKRSYLWIKNRYDGMAEAPTDQTKAFYPKYLDVLAYLIDLGTDTGKEVAHLVGLTSAERKCWKTTELVDTLARKALKDIKKDAQYISLHAMCKDKKIEEMIRYIFSYDTFSGDDTSRNWNRNKFVASLGVEVCPYCNRNFITNYDGEKTTAEADHFHPQNTYPLLALSAYNFVPSCHRCNNIKKEKDKKLLYPYERGFDQEISFYISDLIGNLDEIEDISTGARSVGSFTEDLTQYSNLGAFEIRIGNLVDLDAKTKEQLANSMGVFQLGHIYQGHKRYVVDLLRRIVRYDKGYIQDIGDIKGLFDDIKLTEESFFGYFMYDEMQNVPLSKMSTDLLKRYSKRKY